MTNILSARNLNELMQDEAQVFSLMASLSIDNQAAIDELQVVFDFPEVFPDDILDVPPEREMEFSIGFVPGAKPVSMELYMMSASN